MKLSVFLHVPPKLLHSFVFSTLLEPCFRCYLGSSVPREGHLKNTREKIIMFNFCRLFRAFLESFRFNFTFCPFQLGEFVLLFSVEALPSRSLHFIPFVCLPWSSGPSRRSARLFSIWDQRDCANKNFAYAARRRLFCVVRAIVYNFHILILVDFHDFLVSLDLTVFNLGGGCVYFWSFCLGRPLTQL